MNIKNILYLTMAGVSLSLTSCDDFLDKMPDNRAEINTPQKVTSLLVSAYPTNTTTPLMEYSSDNAVDNGVLYSIYQPVEEAAYLWKDDTNTGNDDPKSVWDAHYGATASANQALQAIEEMGNPESLNPQRGEALIARAYNHFALACCFCLAYNPETADKDFGLPYADKPETQVKVDYHRGTMKELYDRIQKDIEDGLPLINDESYTVPKYHWNRKAANAFAARFYLFRQEYQKAIDCANVVLGNDPTTLFRNWAEMNGMANANDRENAYINASQNANLIIMPVISAAPYILGRYSLATRYAFSFALAKTVLRSANVWGAYNREAPGTYLGTALYGSDQKVACPVVGAYFEYTDKANGIGYLHGVTVPFTTEETILVRAEANILLGNTEAAMTDINHFIHNVGAKRATYTAEQIDDFYQSLNYCPLNIPDAATNETDRTIKMKLNPLGYKVENGVQESLIHFILTMRRVMTIHQGNRFMDIKRYGIEIAHNRAGQTDDVLTLDDPRRAIQLPQDVIEAGLEANPRNFDNK